MINKRMQAIDEMLSTFMVSIERPFGGLINIEEIDDVLVLASENKEAINRYWCEYYEIPLWIYLENVAYLENKTLCKAQTKKGKPCRKYAIGSRISPPPHYTENNFYCEVHQPK